MNKLLLSILLAFVGIVNCQAQQGDYRPLVEEGKTWWMRHNAPENPNWPTPFYYSYYISGDTLIGGTSYKKLWVDNWYNKGLTEYEMALREEGKKVFFVPKGKDKEYVLYNFNCYVGQSVKIDSWKNPGTFDFDMDVFEELDGVFAGMERKMYQVRAVIPDLKDWEKESEEYEQKKFWWIEGIGSERGPLTSDGPGGLGNPHYFKRCELNGEVIFDISWLHQYTGITDAASKDADSSHKGMYDLQGRRVGGEPKAGIYIRGGRKVVVR